MNQEDNNDKEVNRDNIFDYVSDYIISQESGDASLIKFQEPSYNGSVWTIMANNKSG